MGPIETSGSLEFVEVGAGIGYTQILVDYPDAFGKAAMIAKSRKRK
jgi:hypothetical protein